jgi:hypothetical protein
MSIVERLIIALVLAELFEAILQRADTLYGAMEKLYSYYNKSIFLFFLVQPSLYIIIFASLLTGVLNMSMIFLLALKIFDMFYKLELIESIFIKRKVPDDIAVMLRWKIPSWFFLMGLLLYPPLLYYALI